MVLLLLKRKCNSFVECAAAQAKVLRMKTMARQQVSFDLSYFLLFMLILSLLFINFIQMLTENLFSSETRNVGGVLRTVGKFYCR